MKKFLSRINHHKFLLGCILILGASLRLYGMQWDHGFHLHPDERAIILFSLPLQFPLSFEAFFSPSSSWNPHFFAYGSFPLYLLKTLGSFSAVFTPNFSSYDGIHIIGRITSALFDIGTIFVLYVLTRKLFSQSIALLAAFFYAVSVLPIQLSHFYAVDTLLTFFTLFLLYQLIAFYENPTKRKAIGIGILFAFALATKTSAFVLFIAIIVAIGSDFIFLFLRQPHKPVVWFPHVPHFFRRLLIEGSLILLSTVGTFFLLEPYAFIDFQEFWIQTMQQSAMAKSAFTFPYTLQYVGKIPYLYEIKNIFFWGIGPLLGIATLFGIVLYHKQIFQKRRSFWQKEVIFLSFFWVYFFIIGSFAIGFMRYILPLYPFFALFAALFVYSVFIKIYKNLPIFSFVLLGMYLLCILLWPFSFMHIYQNQPTRLSATQWILKHIPTGKTVGIEHWDDGLPLYGQQNYTMVTFELYQPDTPQKWITMNEQLTQVEYIILASNRLYVPLSKLTDCTTLPSTYCYKDTALYYKNLFAGNLGFTKVAEFSVFPKIPFLQIPLDDTSADESFTVYDHPKIIIFQKNK